MIYKRRDFTASLSYGQYGFPRMGRFHGRKVRQMLDFMCEMQTARDLTTFRARLPGAVARLVPADITTYFEIDRRRRAMSTVSHPIGAVSASDEQLFSWHMHQSPLFRSYRQGVGSAAKISDFLTRPKFRRLALHDEFFRRIGMEYQMAKGLPAAPGSVIGVALNRRHRDFAERDRALLNRLGPYLNEAYRSAQLVAQVRQELDLLYRGFDTIERGLVVLDAAGGVRSITTRARQWITDYFGRMPNGGLPDALRRFIEHDEARLVGAGTFVTARAPLMVERDGRRLSVRIVCDGEQRLLVLDEHSIMPKAEGLKPLGLSPRQAEVLSWIAVGKTNADIATILGMSERTVEKRIEHIFRTLEVETRTAAAARAMSVPGWGTGGAPVRRARGPADEVLGSGDFGGEPVSAGGAIRSDSSGRRER
jgi:DNA-binding CsgD family transcriptional regulator